MAVVLLREIPGRAPEGGTTRPKISGLAVLVAVLVTVLFSATSASASTGGTGSLSLSASTCSASTGCTLTVSGSGFEAGETIDLTLHSTPTGLGTTRADSSGAFSTTVSVPAATPAGTHMIIATGETSATTASASFTVTVPTATATTIAATPVPTTATTAVTSTPSTPLPFSGADVAALLGVGAVALALGGAFLLSAGRRRGRHVSTR